MKPVTDYHIHTSLCGHARGSMEDYVEHAVHIGLQEMGFTDHLPFGPDFEHGHTMQRDELSLYGEEIERLQKAYPEINILLGAELGLYPGFEGELAELRQLFPLDYIIGSVHYFGTLFVFQDTRPCLSDEAMAEEINAYFDLHESGVKSGLIDIVGHIDALTWMFPGEQPLLENRMDNLLNLIGKKGVILEINTSGLRKRADDFFPSVKILEKAANRSVKFCLGSDAHTPGHIGSDFDIAVQMLHTFGYSGGFCSRKSLKVYKPS